MLNIANRSSDVGYCQSSRNSTSSSTRRTQSFTNSIKESPRGRFLSKSAIRKECRLLRKSRQISSLSFSLHHLSAVFLKGSSISNKLANTQTSYSQFAPFSNALGHMNGTPNWELEILPPDTIRPSSSRIWPSRTHTQKERSLSPPPAYAPSPQPALNQEIQNQQPSGQSAQGGGCVADEVKHPKIYASRQVSEKM